jgi:hypothetical protein
MEQIKMLEIAFIFYVSTDEHNVFILQQLVQMKEVKRIYMLMMIYD